MIDEKKLLEELEQWKEIGFYNADLIDEMAVIVNEEPKVEKKLIDDIQFAINVSNTKHDNYITGFRNGLRFCLALVNGNKPEFEKCNQWIPCSERLPEENGYYQATCESAMECFIVCDLWFEDGTWYPDADNTCNCVQKVVAWMPLPEPYDGEK